MPFVREFDDVYATIKSSVEGALAAQQLRCFRLDEARPAGRITDRLLGEIQAASLCVADLSGLKPNIMWEVGYAMALGKPTIIVTQDKGDLPFDLKDMQSIQYDRNHLSETLGRSLKRAVIDTHNAQASSEGPRDTADATKSENLVGELLEQVRELKNMLGQAVRTWNPSPQQASEKRDDRRGPAGMEGAWVYTQTAAEGHGSHFYARIVQDELVVPYCFKGNDNLTGTFYGFKRTGEYWFARFRWLRQAVSGFAFLKQESLNLVTGAWWMDDEVEQIPEAPALGSGVPICLERKKDAQFPHWALSFFEEVSREGVVARLARRQG
jgi:nucleoside 2-deoxyribosyltransferase